MELASGVGVGSRGLVVGNRISAAPDMIGFDREHASDKTACFAQNLPGRAVAGYEDLTALRVCVIVPPLFGRVVGNSSSFKEPLQDVLDAGNDRLWSGCLTKEYLVLGWRGCCLIGGR